ncbi:polymorphic toxin-type HINT domain-containing protein [Streptomyces xanthochromogenes]|uniref:polymorphic toxin-type HINT domain-containing protein n=1 Tax=Streptomyces xanthochromogenes TaxID=67384 RepID=UPI002F403875
MTAAASGALSATLALAILAGSTGDAAAATTARAEQASLTETLASFDRLAASLPKAAKAPAAPAPSELDKVSAERDRQLVEDYAEFDEEEEVREAARKALESSDPNAVKEFLAHGEAEARQRAKDKGAGADVKNRQQIEAMRGTGGPVFNAEVERVLKGDARARADFLAFGADIARTQDKKNEQNAKERAAELRKRVEMLVASGGPEVKKAAAAALATNDDKVIAEFLDKGYLVAENKDAADRAAHEKALKDAQEAADKLRDLAEKAARAAEARTKLIAAHGDAVKALKEASNAMTSAAGQARQADRMLSADRAGKALSSYDGVKAEAARQVTIANDAARAAKVAAAQAKVQADVLVETGLTYGTQWSDVASGIAAAAEAAVKAGQTAQKAIEATEADAKGLNAKNQAQLHEQQAKAWRANAVEHAKVAASLADAAGKQAQIAADAAARTKTARIAAEKAEKEAWEHAKKTREAREEAQRQAKIAAEQRAIAERERDLAAQARARAEKERNTAAAARARAEAEARTASAARAEAQAAGATAAQARAHAAEQEGIASKADENARGEETKARTAWYNSRAAKMDADAKEARAQATLSMASAAKGTQYSVQAQTAAAAARADADTASAAAGQAQNAANSASGAAVRARSAATEAARERRPGHGPPQQKPPRTRHGRTPRRTRPKQPLPPPEPQPTAPTRRLPPPTPPPSAPTPRPPRPPHRKPARALPPMRPHASPDWPQPRPRTPCRQPTARRKKPRGATREAAMARLQSNVAVQAAAGARSIAAGIAEPANTAIELTAPFSGKDVDADFAAAVAAAAQDLGEEQVASAQAKATEAGKAAEVADEAAKRANAEVAPAFKAAADAAHSSADAARSMAAAMKSAAEAAADGAKARAAAARANQADAQAQEDARLANAAAKQAFADATAARQAANAAEAEAARARGAATEAENHAAAAAGAATLAEKEASVAQGAATQAAKDAEDAGKLADSAATHAKSAKESADNALNLAKEADEVAKKAEAEQEERQRKDLEEAANAGKADVSDLSDEEMEDLAAAGISREDFEKAQKLAGKTFEDFLLEIGGELLEEYFDVKNIKKCYSEGNVEACFWSLVNNLPWGKALRTIEKFPEIAKAIKRLAGIGGLLKESAAAKNLLKKSDDILDKLWKQLDCTRKHSFSPTTPVLLADGTHRLIKDVRIGDQVVATDPESGRTDARTVTNYFTTEDDKDFTRLVVSTTQGPATITATSNHPFWLSDRKEWVDAGDVRVGNRLRTPEGSTLAVTGVVNYRERQRTHDLTVADFHSYYVGVGTADALVHNCTDLQAAKRRFQGQAHTHSDHINPTPARIAEKLEKDGIVSIWKDEATAQAAVDDVVKQNASWFRNNLRTLREGEVKELPVKSYGENSLGKVLKPNNVSGDAGNRVQVVIKKASKGPDGKKVPGGYYIYTAYPL